MMVLDRKERIRQIIENEAKSFKLETKPLIDSEAEGSVSISIFHDDMDETFFPFIESLKGKLVEEGFQIKNSDFFFSYYIIKIE